MVELLNVFFCIDLNTNSGREYSGKQGIGGSLQKLEENLRAMSGRTDSGFSSDKSNVIKKEIILKEYEETLLFFLTCLFMSVSSLALSIISFISIGKILMAFFLMCCEILRYLLRKFLGIFGNNKFLQIAKDGTEEEQKKNKTNLRSFSSSVIFFVFSIILYIHCAIVLLYVHSSCVFSKESYELYESDKKVYGMNSVFFNLISDGLKSNKSFPLLILFLLILTILIVNFLINCFHERASVVQTFKKKDKEKIVGLFINGLVNNHNPMIWNNYFFLIVVCALVFSLTHLLFNLNDVTQNAKVVFEEQQKQQEELLKAGL